VITGKKKLRGNRGQNKARGEPMVPCAEAHDVVVAGQKREARLLARCADHPRPSLFD